MKKESLADLDDSFELQAKEYLLEITALVNELEGEILFLTDPERRSAGLQRLANQVHSIKGSAGSYGFDLISSICHNFEDRIAAIRIDSKDLERLVDGLLRYIDHLKTAVTAYLNKDSDTLESLRSLINAIAPLANSNLQNSPASPNRKRVLAIEKRSGPMLRMISHALKQCDEHGIDIAIAYDSYEGLGRLLRERFDCVIMSNNSNLITGTALLHLLSETSNPNQKTPAILLTSTAHLALSQVLMPVEVLEKTADLQQRLTEHLVQILGTAKSPSAPMECYYKDILLVDDSVFIHRLLRMALAKVPGVELRCVTSAHEAVTALRHRKPDFLLLDYQMPEMDGLEFANFLKNNEEGFAAIPFAFLTGNTSVADQINLQKVKPLSIIKKPFMPLGFPNLLNKLYLSQKTKKAA